MRRLQVRLPRLSYEIVIGQGILKSMASFLKRIGLKGKVLVATDPRIARLHLPRLEDSLKKGGVEHRILYLPQGERAKEEKVLFQIYRFLLRNGFERRDAVLAFGGGTVGDAAGFAASTYLRGVPLIQVGTTLLAQADSSLGGKTGINLPEGKNLVGTFYQPRLVVSDVELLRTLERRELAASMAEVVKVGMIRDAGLFQYLERNIDKILAGNPDSLEHIVWCSARAKARVVEKDERETKGERMILNYGHTFGHAFEASQNYRGIRHGEAVALGMASAARVSLRRGLIPAEVELRQNRLLARCGLPTRVSERKFPFQKIIRPMLHDKKKRGGKLRFVLPQAIGRAGIFDDVSPEELKAVFRELEKKSHLGVRRRR